MKINYKDTYIEKCNKKASATDEINDKGYHEENTNNI